MHIYKTSIARDVKFPCDQSELITDQKPTEEALHVINWSRHNLMEIGGEVL